MKNNLKIQAKKKNEKNVSNIFFIHIKITTTYTQSSQQKRKLRDNFVIYKVNVHISLLCVSWDPKEAQLGWEFTLQSGLGMPCQT